MLLAETCPKSLTPLIGLVVIVRAGVVEWGGVDPCGRPDDSQPLPPFLFSCFQKWSGVVWTLAVALVSFS